MLRVLRKPTPLRTRRRNERKYRRNNNDERQADRERNLSNVLHYIGRSPARPFPNYKPRCVYGGDGRSRTYDTADMSRML